MALFSTLPVGSGKISPLWPNLVLRWSEDGLGLVFEDLSTNFLLVWNGTSQNIQIEYSPGIFTQTLVKYTGELVHAGPQTWNFKSYPQGLGFDWEIDRYPSGGSSYGFPSSYSPWARDTSYNSHTQGDGRRYCTWPPLRGMRWHPTQSKKDEAFAATMDWCITQLRRPLAHIAGFKTPFLNVGEYDAGFDLNKGTGDVWDGDMTVTLPDLDGIPQDWNAFDPPHNAGTAQFALACADHPFGVCLLWLLYSWLVQGMPPGTRNPFGGGSYGYPFDQERSWFWTLQLFWQCFAVGIEWADPDLIKNWCGGLKPTNNNGGLGWRPRDALRWFTDVFVGPEYGGIGGTKARYMWLMEKPFPPDAHQQPWMTSGTNFDFNGKHYQRCFGSEKAFHRNMLLWIASDLLRAHDYVKGLDATEDLFDPARVSEVRRWARQFSQYVIDTGFIDSWGGAAKGSFRQRTHTFELGVTEKGFESFAALDAAIIQGIADDPICPHTNSAWVYPGTDASLENHLFAIQFARWELGPTLWHIMAGRPTDGVGGADNEGHETGIPAYARAFGYDATLQACMDQYAGQLSDPNFHPDHYETVWRAKEKANASPVPLGTIKMVPKHAGLTVVDPSNVPLGTIKTIPKQAGITIGDPPGVVLGTIRTRPQFAGLNILDDASHGDTYLQLGTISMTSAAAGITVHTVDDPVDDDGGPGGGGTGGPGDGPPDPNDSPPPVIDAGSIDDDARGRSKGGPRIPSGLFVGDVGLHL